MSPEAETVTVTTNDAAPGTLFAIAVFAATSALISFGLARLARRLPEGVPNAVVVVACATLVPIVLVLAGFALFEEENSILEWIATRPPRAYRNLAIFLGLSLFAAGLGLRGRKPTVDPSIFD